MARIELGPVCALGYRGVLGLVAGALTLDPLAAVTADPAANRPSNRLWRDQARARAVALYLVNTETCIPMTLAGRLAGITKQGVSKVLREVETSRDDPATDALIERIAAAVRMGA